MTEGIIGKALQEEINRVAGIGRGFMGSQVLLTANAFGVFGQLTAPRTAEEVAAALELSPRGVRMLLDGLVALELIDKREGRYVNTELGAQVFVPGGAAYQGDILQHNCNLWEAWGSLGESIRIGTRVGKSERERDPAELRAFILGMSNIARFSAREILDAVDLAPYRRLLDVGGGPGTYSIGFLQRHAEMRATVFDLPSVLEIAREQVAAAGLGERIELRPGDLHEDDFGADYDLALISNIIHMLSEDDCAKLMAKAFGAMAPGGLLIVKDFFVDDDRSGPPFSLLFAMNMLVNTDAGDTFTYSQIAGWTRAAGFEEGEPVAITPQSRLWLAKKPGV